MSGPWEDYQPSQPSAERGPWEDYGGSSPVSAQPQEEEKGFFASIPEQMLKATPFGMASDMYGRGQKGQLLTPQEESQLRGVAMGASNLATGIPQYLANAVGMGEGINEALRRKEEEYQAGREASGRTGFDAMRLAGNVIDPVAVLGMKGLSSIAPVITAGERIRQGAGIGGAIGLASPVTSGDDFEAEKNRQAGAGMAIGGAIPAGIAAAGGTYNALKNIISPVVSKKGVTRSAVKVVDDVLGDRREGVMERLGQAEAGETAAQAAAPAGSAEFAGLQRIAAKNDPSRYRDMRLAEESQIGKMWEDLNKKMWPIGKGELDTANIAGKTLPKLQGEAEKLAGAAARKAEDVRRFSAAGERADARAQSWYPVEGMPRTPGRYSYADELSKRADKVAGQAADESLILGEGARFKQMQADSLAKHGLRPLDSNSIISSIDAKLNVPGQRASKVVQATLNDLKERINTHSVNGVLDAHDLYTIRKEIGNSVKTFAKENQNWDKRLTSGLEKNIQSSIDDAVVKAGGSRWKEYLSKYSEGADKINARVQRAEDAKKMGVEGLSKAAKIAKMDEAPGTLPNPLHRGVMIVNAIMRRLEGYGGQKTTDEISRLMANPKELYAVMKAATPEERMILAKAFMSNTAISTGAQAAGRGIGSSE